MNTVRVPKRIPNDCYHNYIWLAFATGSIGGPVPCELPPTLNLKPYDLSGVTYLSPKSVYLNTYTDEILDSMLSLNRFTSLVQWKLADDLYHPVRVHHQSGDTTITLLDATTGQPLSQEQWLWTAASDKTFTLGWIVRNCPRNYDVPESEDSLSTATPPMLRVQNLAAIPLGLVWFDDHLGRIVGNGAYTSSGSLTVQAPNTEGKNGFARSIAFVIQPAGLTANKSFESLPSYPNHLIGQIEVSPRRQDRPWYEEYQYANTDSTLTFTARTKPAISSLQGWRFEWRSFSETAQPTVVQNSNQLTSYCTQAMRLVKVDVYDPQNRRVSGDMITLELVGAGP